MEPLIFTYGEAVKALGDGKIRVKGILFSDESAPDLAGDYFQPDTDFGLEFPTKMTGYYDHGKDPTIGLKKLGGGPMKFTATKDDSGVWFEAQLDIRNEYEEKIYRLAEQKKLGASTGAAVHLVRREPHGDAMKITHWGLAEISLTPTPCEPGTSVEAMKTWDEFLHGEEAKALLPLADKNRVWNSGEATKRIKKWASNDKGEIDFKKYGRAFAEKTGKGDKQGDYGYPFADVINGTLTAVPRGVIAAGNATMGARTGQKPSNAGAIQKVLSPYYKKMKMTPPWENEKSLSIEQFAAKSQYFGDIDEDLSMSALSYLSQQFYYCIVWKIVYDESTTREEKITALSAALDEYKQYVEIVITGLLDPEEGTPDDDMKSLRELWSDPQEKFLPRRTKTIHATKALGEVIGDWDGLILQAEATGQKAGAMLSKANAESLQKLHGSLMEAMSHTEGMMDRAGIDYDEPVDDDEEEVENEAEKAMRDYEIIRARNLGITIKS